MNIVTDLRSRAPRLGRSNAGRTLISWPATTRWIWVALVVAAAVRVAVTIRIFFREVHTPCVAQTCQGPPSMTRQQMHLLHGAGVSPDAYAAWCATVVICFVAVNCAVAGVILWRRPHDAMARLTGFTLILYGGFSLGLPDQLFHQWEPAWWLPAAVLAMLGSIAIVAFLYLFPDGRPVARWTWFMLAGWSVIQVGSYLVPGLPSTLDRLTGSVAAPLGAVIQLGVFASLIYAQVHRYRHVSTPLQREQTKWVVYGIALTIVGWVGLLTYWDLSDVNAARDNPLVDFASWTAGTLLWLIIPLSIGAAILRYRLWDIDLLINRTLVYAALTAMVVGVYVLTVGYLGTLFRTGSNLVVSLVATGAVAMLFQPAREWLQRGVNRLMYGERDEPYVVLSRLGQRLEATVAPQAALSSIVDTIAGSLKLPYAAIGIHEGDAPLIVAAACGSPVPSPLRLPLTYGQEPVGELILGPRRRGEEFTPADLRLIGDIARQVEIAVHAVQVTAALQHSRERLVSAREEERRRLRRDLHDGLGPALASQALALDAARKLIAIDPTAADALLADLTEHTKAAVEDIRRLVYGLRPPALDELGLVAALREEAERYRRADLQVIVAVLETLPPLSAAIDVAVYRIVQEALTNVVRHAGATQARVSLRLDGDRLEVEVLDDGRGTPSGTRAGVGLTSMRERATELGGSCMVQPARGGGTRLVARFPLGEVE